MQQGIHPNYVATIITCACGSVVETKSTQASYKIDTCSACHPFYTGQQKIVDTEGRVERFKKRYGLKK